MGIATSEVGIKLDSFISENDLKELQWVLNALQDNQKIVDLTECDDLHTAAAQLLAAQKITKGCEFIFSGDSAFRKALEGVSLS